MTVEIVDGEWDWTNLTLWDFLVEGNYPPEWKDFFIDNSDILHGISEGIADSAQHTTVYPSIEHTFRAFLPLSKVKLVVLGMDPYHNGSATGLCFSVKPGNKINPSLRNIYQELERSGHIVEKDGVLTHWAEQGCMMLNTSLTVEEKKPDSHTKLWKPFTINVIKHISENTENVAWMLMGNHAQKFEPYIDTDKHKIFKSTHPSPFSYNRSTKAAPAFLGSDIFNKVNEYLPEKITFGKKISTKTVVQTKLVNVRVKNLRSMGYENFKEWVKDPNNVYIGRRVHYVDGTFDSEWCNPFSAKKYGREECCEMFREKIAKIPTEHIKKSLEGKTLGCWCYPEMCHGNVLLDRINE